MLTKHANGIAVFFGSQRDGRGGSSRRQVLRHWKVQKDQELLLLGHSTSLLPSTCCTLAVAASAVAQYRSFRWRSLARKSALSDGEKAVPEQQSHEERKHVDVETSSGCNVGMSLQQELEEEQLSQIIEEEEVKALSPEWSGGVWGADWGPAGPGPIWPVMSLEASKRRRQRRLNPPPSWDNFLDKTLQQASSRMWLGDGPMSQTLLRVVIPTVLAFLAGFAVYTPACIFLQENLDVGNTGRGPVLTLLGMDQSQFMQNFLTVNGLLFTILCGNTYDSLYTQQEMLFHALFLEVSEAKSLLEQACLVCQGRPFYPKVIESIEDYVTNDLRRLDIEPAEILSNRPMDDPLEYILYATSVGVPSVIYDTIRDLRQARAQRLGAMQRKLPPIHFVLLYILGILELLAFPYLGAGTVSLSKESSILTIQGLFFASMCGAIVMTLQVIFELWKPFGGAYTVDAALSIMIKGLEEELRLRRQLWRPSSSRNGRSHFEQNWAKSADPNPAAAE